MGKNKFTKEEIELLKVNPYVRKIGESQIVFTEEFRKICLSERDAGKGTKAIFDEYGIGYQRIGSIRADRSIARFRKQSQREEGFSRIKGSGRHKKIVFDSLEEEIQYLKDEQEYHKKLIEYLKKPEGQESVRKK